MTSHISFWLLSIVSVLSLITVTLACSCPPLTFQNIYKDAGNIVKARVTKVRIIPASETRFGSEEYRYKLRVLTVFKGCTPGKFFRARTVLDGGICSVVLMKGDVLRVVLPAKARRRYDFFGCYDTKSWNLIKKKERRFLRRLRKANICEA